MSTIVPDTKTLNIQVQTRLCELVDCADTFPIRLHQAQHHALLSPGKRIRPLLCILIARGLGFNSTAVIDVGCVAEIIHTASLILDDLPCMDNADLRRNQPALHIVFDESTTILTAMALLTQSFSILARLTNISAHKRIKLVALLSDKVGQEGLISGQMADLENHDMTVSQNKIETLNQYKTGALFDFTIEAASILADAHREQYLSLQKFSAHLGLAFQLMDDFKDQYMDQEEAQKSVNRDQGKATLLALMGSKPTREKLNTHLSMAQDALRDAHLSTHTLLLRILRQQFAFPDA